MEGRNTPEVDVLGCACWRLTGKEIICLFLNKDGVFFNYHFFYDDF